MEAQISAPLVHATSLRKEPFDRLFLLHPRSLGESYWTHQRHALGFAATMIVAGVACGVHALVPAFFVKTGSEAICHLYDRLIELRRIDRKSSLTR